MQIVNWAVWRNRPGNTPEVVAVFRHQDHAEQWRAQHAKTYGDGSYVERLDVGVAAEAIDDRVRLLARVAVLEAKLAECGRAGCPAAASAAVSEGDPK